MVNKHGKVDGEGVLVHSTYRTVIVRNRANFYHVILLPMYVCTLKSGEYSNKVKKGARFFIFGNSRNSEVARAQDFCVKTNKSQ
jgi:hypothetical protein